MQKQKKSRLLYPLGLAVGLLNGLLGSGGGIVAVPALRGLGVEPEACHATSISITLPLAIASGFLYLQAGSFEITDALPYIPGGVCGAICGAWLLPKLGTLMLRRVFGVVIVFAAARLLMR